MKIVELLFFSYIYLVKNQFLQQKSLRYLQIEILTYVAKFTPYNILLLRIEGILP